MRKFQGPELCKSQPDDPGGDTNLRSGSVTDLGWTSN